MSVLRTLPALILLAGCRGEVAGGKADGHAVFVEVCARCHGDGGKPNETTARQMGVRDLTAPEFRARATVELVETQVRNGSANGIMPPFAGTLNEPQIHAVAEYVMSLGK